MAAYREVEGVVVEYSECLGASPYLFKPKRSDRKDTGIVTPTVHLFPANRLDRVSNNFVYIYEGFIRSTPQCEGKNEQVPEIWFCPLLDLYSPLQCRID